MLRSCLEFSSNLSLALDNGIDPVSSRVDGCGGDNGGGDDADVRLGSLMAGLRV